MMIVLASGISRPFSTIVVQTNTSYSCRMKPSSTLSSSASPICPWPTPMRAFGQQLLDHRRAHEDGIDAVVDEVDLPAARQLLLDRRS